MVVNAFYENVPKHRAEHRELAPGEKEKNLVLEFRPNPAHDMLVACLWNHHKGNESGEGELFSFAAITDEPPPEVLAAGHDRCIIPIKPENVNAWLDPDPGNLAALQAILDDRDCPESKKDRDDATKKFPKLKEAFIADAAAKAVAEAKIDSKKAAENFVSRFRDSIAIALHTGRSLPAAEVKAERPRPSKVEDRSQSRSR